MVFRLLTATVECTAEFTSNVSTCTIMLPVLNTIASNMKIHPYLLLIPGTISTSFAFMLPIATPPNAIAFSGGELVVMDMARPGLFANLVGILCTTIFTYTLGSVVFGFGDGNVPPWATSEEGAISDCEVE